MQDNRALGRMDLQLFNGAAAGAAPAGGAPTGGEAAAQTGELSPKAETNGHSGSSRRGRSGEFDNVVFGKQADAPDPETNGSDAGNQNAEGDGKRGVKNTSDTLDVKMDAFQRMIDGEYKQQFETVFQKAFNRRHSEVKTMQDSLAAQKPIIDMLAQRYNIEGGDMAKLQKAIEDDRTYWEQAAEDAGMSVEQYQAVQKLKRENAELKALQQRQDGERHAQEQYARWLQEQETVKQYYPSFDLRTELANRDFQGLIRAGVPMQKAYEVVHMAEINEAAARTAAQTASQQMEAKLKSKAARPSENGTSSQSAVIVRNDVSQLTRAERAEIARRAQRGDKITF